jgi:hypothetical protein
MSSHSPTVPKRSGEYLNEMNDPTGFQVNHHPGATVCFKINGVMVKLSVNVCEISLWRVALIFGHRRTDRHDSIKEALHQIRVVLKTLL